MSAGDDDAAAERGAVVGVLTVRAAVGEGLTAAGTAIRFLAAVKTTVLGQVMFVFERAMTHLARERSQACQHSKQNSLINMHEHSVNTALWGKGYVQQSSCLKSVFNAFYSFCRPSGHAASQG